MTSQPQQYYATMYRGVIRTLNGRYPLLYTDRAVAIRESREATEISVITINPADYDLGQCALDRAWPTGVAYPSGRAIPQGPESLGGAPGPEEKQGNDPREMCIRSLIRCGLTVGQIRAVMCRAGGVHAALAAYLLLDGARRAPWTTPAPDTLGPGAPTDRSGSTRP